MDYPYVIHFFIMLFLAYRFWQDSDEKWAKYAFILEFIFIALRAPVVGADTWDYIRYLDGTRNFYNNDPRDLEVGFVLYRDIVCQIHAPRVFYMVLNTIIFSSPLYYLIKKYSYNVPLTFVFAAIINIYFLYFCGLRQIIGVAILFWGVIYVLENRDDIGKGFVSSLKNWLVYISLASLGYLFHTSVVVYAVIFAVVFFIPIYSRIIPIVCILGSILIGVILQQFDVLSAFDFFLSLEVDATERLQAYLESDELNAIDNIWFMTRNSIFPILAYALMDEEKLDHWLSKIYLIGLVLSNLFISVPMINRMNQVFFVVGIIVLTWVIPYFEKEEEKINIQYNLKIIFILMIIYMGQALVKNNLDSNIDYRSESRMHPYQLFFENYSDHPSIKYFGN